MVKFSFAVPKCRLVKKNESSRTLKFREGDEIYAVIKGKLAKLYVMTVMQESQSLNVYDKDKDKFYFITERDLKCLYKSRREARCFD